MDQIETKLDELKFPLNQAQLLDLILPPKDDLYSWLDVEQALQKFTDEVESVQIKNNDMFDRVLDDEAQKKVKMLGTDLNNANLIAEALQLQINRAKAQFALVNSISNGRLVQERKELLHKEEQLVQSLHRAKFNALKDFFTKFIEHLDISIETCQKLLASNAQNYVQSFEWTHYHQVIYLLRACGKTMIDLDKFERLYQSHLDSYASLEFKQPIDQMDLNNYIEVQTAYSLETQLDVILHKRESSNQHQWSPYQRVDFRLFSLNSDVANVLNSNEPLNYELFRTDKLDKITTRCCRLLIDLNLNYIEAHFTEGITIEKMNGCDNETSEKQDEQILPMYAFSPQEYITKIGQHLLTLRKQTEQFDQIDNRPLKLALEHLNQAQDVRISIPLCSNVTEIILKSIAKHCIRSLVGRTTNSILSKLTPNGRRQLATDATYLDNVLEDLGLLDPKDPYVGKFKSLFGQ